LVSYRGEECEIKDVEDLLDTFKENANESNFESIFQTLRSRERTIVYCWNKIVVEMLAN
jgi:hypothetical protein